jgi:hypothetical protein
LEPLAALHPTVARPITDLVFAAVFRTPVAGVVVPIPTFPVKSAMKRAMGALYAPIANPVLYIAWMGWLVSPM